MEDLTLLLFLLLAAGASGHGMVMEPVNRASMWRLGFHTPKDYDDDGHFCGGISVQWEQNGGKCGECGDDYALPRPRPSENTGKYGRGISVKTYKSGQAFTAAVDLTANHKGYFQFDLCPLRSADELETDECFSRYPLSQAEGSTQYRVPSTKPGYYNVSLVLPAGLRCERCVFRWTYVAGNNWGICSDGSGADGCGPQENFRTCSDITIA
ncbi:uncharacterized protein LOC134533804 [Bacillus rossius redtenbacheri]|uniref:uncharacterized protein LOC134533804 n=1 Tax=Bacillus rossius redtenbacheri TaxID=93214 RepID=UPI002FDEA200